MSTPELTSETAGVAPTATGDKPARAPLFDPLEIGVGVCGAALVAAAGLMGLQSASTPVRPAVSTVSTAPITIGSEWSTVGQTPAMAEAAARGMTPAAPVAARVPGVASPGVANAHGVAQAGGGRLAGGMGRMGPLTGPLSTALPGGGVGGPQWRGAPLPGVGGRPTGIFPGIEGADGEPRSNPSSTANVVSSELPDARTLELSRLANPETQLRPAAPRPTPAPAASAEKPLRMSLVVARPSRGIQVGSFVPVRISATSDCYLALLRVDTDGKASTVFRSPGASQSFTCAVKAGPGAGPVYLVAVASSHPLSGAEAANTLRTLGGGFPTLTTAAGGADAGSAWAAALSQASALGGTARPWQRYEWAAATGSFLVPPPRQLTVAPPVVRQVVPRTAPKGETAVDEGSALPTPEPTSTKPRSEPTPSTEPSLLPGGKSQAAPALEGTRPMLPPTTR